jgi:L-fuculose-phosphate aldolase
MIFSIGNVAFAGYATPTTNEVASVVKEHINGANAILLSNHGALTVGKDVFDAYFKMETLEHSAGIILYSKLLGGEKKLSAEQVEQLYKIKADLF